MSLVSSKSIFFVIAKSSVKFGGGSVLWAVSVLLPGEVEEKKSPGGSRLIFKAFARTFVLLSTAASVLNRGSPIGRAIQTSATLLFKHVLFNNKR